MSNRPTRSVRFLTATALTVCALSAGARADPHSVTTAADLARAVMDEADTNVVFRIEAVCTFPERDFFFFEDATGGMVADTEHRTSRTSVKPGDRVFFKGYVRRIEGRIRAVCTEAVVLSSGSNPPAHAVSGASFADGSQDFRHVRITGILNDVVLDETDPRFFFLYVLCDGERIIVPRTVGTHDLDAFRRAIGSTLSISGICLPFPLMSRQQIGHTLAPHAGDTIATVAPPPADPYDVPTLREFYRLSAEKIAKLGPRRTSGRVLAVWKRSNVLVRTGVGTLVQLTLREPVLPRVGDAIEAVGLPETDLYRINLAYASWRPAAPSVRAGAPDAPERISADDLFRDARGNARFDVLRHGGRIALEGTVRLLPAANAPDPALQVECDGHLLPLDLSSAPEAAARLATGCRIAFTGRCIMEIENRKPHVAFQEIRSVRIALDGADALRLVARAPFLTPVRAWSAIAVLAALLAGVLVLVALLRKLIRRRSHQLFREKAAHYAASLRVDERTKLAVELHDSLSQSLTGVCLELETAGRLVRDGDAALRPHLSAATTALRSCHEELRNCLWDLRNMSLEETDMNAAIRKTLAPHTRGRTLSVRFAVARSRFSDNTAHAILRIIRELTVNAVRHGGATAIAVAGARDGDRILVSVRDNGCGFDPRTAPGIRDGHFGLSGIRERLALLHGSLAFMANPGGGMRAVIDIPIPSKEGTTR